VRKLSASGLKKKADRLFSQYIRRFHADEGGTVSCVSCGKLMHWKESENGHYIKRGHLSLRYDERNCAPQCTRCNRYMGGNQDEYAVYLVKKYGPGIIEELHALKHQAVKWYTNDWRELVSRIEAKLQTLEGA
jgi:hypothetical protein